MRPGQQRTPDSRLQLSNCEGAGGTRAGAGGLCRPIRAMRAVLGSPQPAPAKMAQLQQSSGKAAQGQGGRAPPAIARSPLLLRGVFSRRPFLPARPQHVGPSAAADGAQRSTAARAAAVTVPAVKPEEPRASGGYPFLEIEKKWQAYWAANQTFRTPDQVDTSKPKYYVLDMFPYPRWGRSTAIYSVCRVGGVSWSRQAARRGPHLRLLAAGICAIRSAGCAKRRQPLAGACAAPWPCRGRSGTRPLAPRAAVRRCRGTRHDLVSLVQQSHGSLCARLTVQWRRPACGAP